MQEVDEILTKARMFQFKPDGDVTFMTFQDAQGLPITTFQDPLHYPHNTKFLAPGATSYNRAALAICSDTALPGEGRRSTVFTAIWTPHAHAA